MEAFLKDGEMTAASTEGKRDGVDKPGNSQCGLSEEAADC